MVVWPSLSCTSDSSTSMSSSAPQHLAHHFYQCCKLVGNIWAAANLAHCTSALLCVDSKRSEEKFLYLSKPWVETAQWLKDDLAHNFLFLTAVLAAEWEWVANCSPVCPMSTAYSRLGNNNFSLKTLPSVPILSLEQVTKASQHVTLQSNLQNKDAAGSSWGGFVCYFLSHSSADKRLSHIW